MTLRSRVTRAASSCFANYHKFRNMAVRTDDFLVGTVQEAYDFAVEMEADDALRDALYAEARSKDMRTSADHLLFWVEYAFMPYYLVRRGKREVKYPVEEKKRKNDLNKASMYAKVISYMLSDGVKTSDFKKYIRDRGGLEAVADLETRRAPRRKARQATSGASPTAARKQQAPSLPPFPLILCCADDQVVRRAWDAWADVSNSQNEFLIKGRIEASELIVTDFSSLPRSGARSSLRPFPHRHPLYDHIIRNKGKRSPAATGGKPAQYPKTEPSTARTP